MNSRAASRAIVVGLLDALAVPAYVTDRLNRLCAVNSAYCNLVGNPVGEGFRGDALFVTHLILGPYRDHFPRRARDVAGWAPFLEPEVRQGHLQPRVRDLFYAALDLDEDARHAAEQATDEGLHARWDAGMLFRTNDGHFRELRETAVPLAELGVSASGPAFLNIWLEREAPALQPPSERLSLLTAREREVASLLAAGLSAREVAAACSLSLHTVHDHRDSIYARLGVHSRVELVLAVFPAAAGRRPGGGT